MKYFTLFFIMIIFFGSVLAQNGTLTGIVIEEENPVENVIVKIQGKDFSAQTDLNGRYQIKNIPYGEYYVLFMKSGYYSLVMPDVKINSEDPVSLNADMVRGNEDEYLFLEVGGIKVTAARELISENPETIYRISSGEIEHMQANSLANVLDLIPGNEKTNSSGLDRPQKIALRNFNSPEDYNQDLSLFGTKIIIDDTPLSNNADLQAGVGVGFGSNVQSNASGQYDLREVVADNLQKVEVMSGASSVEYGDHATGLILVTTKTSNVPTRFRYKNNPDTREANLNGSFSMFNTDFVYNANYGYSERDIRIDGDEFHRIAGELKALNRFAGNTLKLTQILRYNRVIEEDNDQSDPYRTKAYNRDHHFVYTNILDYQWNETTNVYFRAFVDYNRRNSWKHKLETPDLAVWTDRMTPGTTEGIIPESATYFSDVTTIGDEWNIGAKLKMNKRLYTGPFLHNLLVGGEFILDQNNGPGKYYDILKPPNGENSTRPRSFDDTPAVLQMAFFFEDRISGDWILPYTINLGLRIDTYNPRGLVLSSMSDLFRSRQGTFFNPRIGLKLTLAPRTLFRFNFSRSSKIPPLSSITPENFFLDVMDYTTRQVQGGGDTTIALVSTYMYDRTVLDLKGYQSTKFEAAFDRQFGDVGVSLLGFYQYADNIPITRNQYVPFMYNRYFWPNWPDSSGREIIETVTTTDSKYSIANNVSNSEGYGVELTLRSHRIPDLNMIFGVNAAFNFKRYSYDDYRHYGNTRTLEAGEEIGPDWILEEPLQVIPFYYPYDSWRQKMVVNYSIDYLNSLLGIWLRFKAQQVLLDEDLNIENPTYSARGFYAAGEHYQINKETSSRLGLDRSFDELNTIIDRSRLGSKWLFSVTASKSLYKGAEISFFVENIFNDRAYYYSQQGTWSARSPEIYWGIGFSTMLDDVF